MGSSIHRVEVVEFKIKEKHPNADTLSLADIFDGGYQYCCKTESWQGKTRAYFIPPDNLVPVNRPEFAFLASEAKSDGYARIKAKKLRGIVSYGLMIEAPEDSVIGTDATELLGVLPYCPETANAEKGPKLNMGDNCAGPDINCPKYHLENLRKYHSVFQAGEPVFITEKLDGQSIKFCYHNEQMFCGSMNLWKREYAKTDHLTLEYFLENGVNEVKAKYLVENLKKREAKQDWVWQTKDQVEQDVCGTRCSYEGPIDKFCKDNEDCVLYGESYGNTHLKYGLKNGILNFAAFDLYKAGKFVDYQEFAGLMIKYQIPMVPALFNKAIPYNFEQVKELCDGMSLLCPTQIKEGVVVTPEKERWDHKCGRLKLKCVSPTYSEKKK